MVLKKANFSISLLLLLSSILTLYIVSCTDYSEEDLQQTIDSQVLTCSSTIRIQNMKSGYFLHSHDLGYGTGSGQQSVTGMENDHDYNSLWIVKEAELTTPDG